LAQCSTTRRSNVPLAISKARPTRFHGHPEVRSGIQATRKSGRGGHHLAFDDGVWTRRWSTPVATRGEDVGFFAAHPRLGGDDLSCIVRKHRRLLLRLGREATPRNHRRRCFGVVQGAPNTRTWRRQAKGGGGFEPLIGTMPIRSADSGTAYGIGGAAEKSRNMATVVGWGQQASLQPTKAFATLLAYTARPEDLFDAVRRGRQHLRLPCPRRRVATHRPAVLRRHPGATTHHQLGHGLVVSEPRT